MSCAQTVHYHWIESGETASAEMIGRDPQPDLAFLKTDADLAKCHFRLLSIRWAVSFSHSGRPGRTVQATFGIISAVGGEWRTGMGGVIDQYVQTDVMYPASPAAHWSTRLGKWSDSTRRA